MNIKMKFIITALLIIGFSQGKAQSLISNGSFENYSQCPSSYNQVPLATAWMQSFENNASQYHAEYMHGCNTGNFGIPTNVWGSQMPSSGQGYVAIAMKAPIVSVDYRENIYTMLSSPLTVEHTYHASFKVSHCELSTNCSNNMGMKFSTSPTFRINNVTQVHSSSVITDEIGWTTIEGDFFADSAYSYVAIGNFYTDANTKDSLVYPSHTVNYPAYYFDEIVVTDITGINELNATKTISYDFILTPDGPGLYDLLKVHGISESSDYTLKVYNNSGSLIFESSDLNKDSWNGQANRRTATGMYFYQLIGNEKQYKGRVVVL
jgi:gliding motility-associated-like protein